MPNCCPCTMGGANQIDRNNPLEFESFHIVARGRRLNARIVDQNVELAESADDFGHHGVDRRGGTYIGALRRRSAGVFRDRFVATLP